MVSRCLVLTVLVACGPVKGNLPDPDPDGPSVDGSFQLAVLTVNPIAPLDGLAEIELAITRDDFDGEITIAGVTPPNGIEIQPLTVAAGETTAELVVGAVSPLVIGDTVSFTIEATAAGLEPQQATIEDAEVTGKPGSLDITWGDTGTGYATISFGSNDNGQFEDMDILAGKVIATGFGVGGLGAKTFATARFLETGAVDVTFDSNPDPAIAQNLVRVDFDSGSNEDSPAVAIGHQIDGRPIIIGNTQGSAGSGIAAARLSNTGGDGGNDFGNLTGARLRLEIGATETVRDGLVLPGGRILFVGDDSARHFIAISNGSALDTSFGTGGFVRETIGTASAAIAVALDAEDRFVVLGTTNTANAVDLIISRYVMTGLDNTFGVLGRITIDRAENLDATAIAVLPSGKILIASSFSDAGGTHYQLFRLEDDGSLDATFGTDGVAEIVAPGTPSDMIVLPNGKIMMLGQGDDVATLVRFKANGAIDNLFGDGGIVTVPFGDDAQVRCIAIYDSQKVVVGGGNGGAVPGPGIKGVIARLWF